MARKRKDANEPKIKLAQPDRSGPDPNEKTLYKWAEERNLFEEAKRREAAAKTAAAKKDGSNTSAASEEDENVMSPGEERVAEAVLWTVTIAMLHFTLDTLVQHQYAQEINWRAIGIRTAQAFAVFLALFYTLHPHVSSPNLIPGLPTRYQHAARQTIFFIGSILSGCYLIYITNSKGYLAVQKKAPPLACMWLWTVIELNLVLSVVSVACAGAFIWYGDYEVK
ncbi:hypothetical protein jhhlp_000103 [Lomentospora prolificans]|uniref:DUF7719 domain-containing protein n=1 Tax=Lomentospora prolificans TaxID=41688 RepID=A0A2N3NLS5_9PEZI|nr:hypothetical protein jhhlp_000103 [Lomentospora prolificans]